ncbi:MAG TPA: hypothetical protein VF837_04940 [Patescibacteria group bacterium]
MRKKIKQEKHDRLLRVADSSEELSDFAHDDSWPKEMVISGDLGIGKKGNPVTILVEDELTGETLEVNNVRSAFLVLEDTRKSTNGWLAMAIGSYEKLSSVLTFLSQTTLESLRKLVDKEN